MDSLFLVHNVAEDMFSFIVDKLYYYNSVHNALLEVNVYHKKKYSEILSSLIHFDGKYCYGKKE